MNTLLEIGIGSGQPLLVDEDGPQMGHVALKVMCFGGVYTCIYSIYMMIQDFTSHGYSLWARTFPVRGLPMSKGRLFSGVSNQTTPIKGNPFAEDHILLWFWGVMIKGTSKISRRILAKRVSVWSPDVLFGLKILGSSWVVCKTVAVGVAV